MITVREVAEPHLRGKFFALQSGKAAEDCLNAVECLGEFEPGRCDLELRNDESKWLSRSFTMEISRRSAEVFGDRRWADGWSLDHDL
jgi:hypothetical protein